MKRRVTVTAFSDHHWVHHRKAWPRYIYMYVHTEQYMYETSIRHTQRSAPQYSAAHSDHQQPI